MSTIADPYVGPSPYTVGRKLYGRDREARELLDRLTSRRAVLLHAPSGAGKTSLIQAGLLHRLSSARLRTEGPLRVNDVPPTGAGSANRYAWSLLTRLEEQLPVEARLPPAALLEERLGPYFERRAGGTASAELLILDQFEEVLTLDPADQSKKADFFAQLGAALRSELRLLVAMRTDYVGALEPYLKPLPDHLGNRMFMDFLSRPAAIEAVQGPAADAGVVFELPAAQALVDDLSMTQVLGDRGTPERVVGPHVEPVHLQAACRELWSRKAKHFESGSRTITKSDVLTIGGVDDALANYYDRKVQAVARDGVPERRIRDWFDQELITRHGVRGQVQEERGATSRGLENSAIRALIDAYLVREENRRGARWFELSHDRLILPVVGSNGRWRAAHLTEVQKQAGEWLQLGKRPELLIRDEARLRAAESWARAHAGEATPLDREFLDTSRAAQNEAQRTSVRRAQLRTNLADTGWAVVFSGRAGAAEREALAELLAHRRAEAASKREARYKETRYVAGETAAQFLARYGVGSGPPNPDRVPYYLLLVGGPEDIPFEVQYDLDLQYAVGRIAFDELADYAVYARSVVTSETMGESLPRRATIVAPTHDEDHATRLIAKQLVGPLLRELTELVADWSVDVVQEQATKAQIGQLLGGEDSPALLLFAGHGLMGASEQNHGALVTADWRTLGKDLVPELHTYDARDVAPDANLLGTIAFLFSAYSAGMPELDEFSRGPGPPRRLAPRPSLAKLPQRLLSAPRGGALAVIGHVDRTWGFSIREGELADVGAFSSTMRALMTGATVGAAVDYFNQRYAALAAQLVAMLLGRGKDAERELAIMRAIDARNYIVIGDPAVRLPVDDRAVAVARPEIVPVDREPWARFVDVEVAPPEDHTLDVAITLTGVATPTGQPELPPIPRSELATLVVEQRASDELATRFS